MAQRRDNGLREQVEEVPPGLIGLLLRERITTRESER